MASAAVGVTLSPLKFSYDDYTLGSGALAYSFLQKSVSASLVTSVQLRAQLAPVRFLELSVKKISLCWCSAVLGFLKNDIVLGLLSSQPYVTGKKINTP